MNKRVVLTHSTDLPPPGGHYSHAAAWRDLVFVSGQLPVTREGTPAADMPFDAQARLAIGNLLTILRAAGTGPANLVKVTAYIVGVGNWPAFNQVYAELLGAHRPARAVVPVPELHYGCLVEVDAVAVCPDAVTTS